MHVRPRSSDKHVPSRLGQDNTGRGVPRIYRCHRPISYGFYGMKHMQPHSPFPRKNQRASKCAAAPRRPEHRDRRSVKTSQQNKSQNGMPWRKLTRKHQIPHPTAFPTLVGVQPTVLAHTLPPRLSASTQPGRAPRRSRIRQDLLMCSATNFQGKILLCLQKKPNRHFNSAPG